MNLCLKLAISSVIILLLTSTFSYSRDWIYICSGIYNGNQKFNVFIDQDSIKQNDDQVEFWQGHVFNSAQRLNNSNYNKINLLRSIDCNQQKGRIIRAFFYDGTVEVINKVFDETESANLKNINKNGVDGEVLKFICNRDKD